MFNLMSNIEKEFFLNNLKTELRKDNRKLTSFRTIKIEKMTYDGQVIVNLGNNKVFSQIFAKLVCPDSDRPNEGIILFNVHPFCYLG